MAQAAGSASAAGQSCAAASAADDGGPDTVKHSMDEIGSGYFNLSIQDLLAQQFSMVHQALVAAQEDIQRPLETRWETAQRIESEVRDLRVENSRLRACLASSPGDFATYTQTGGTGESCGSSEVKTRGGPTTDASPLPAERPLPLPDQQWVVPVPPQQPAAFRPFTPADDAPEMALPGCSDPVMDFQGSATLAEGCEDPIVVQDVLTEAKVNSQAEGQSHGVRPIPSILDLPARLSAEVVSTGSLPEPAASSSTSSPSRRDSGGHPKKAGSLVLHDDPELKPERGKQTLQWSKSLQEDGFEDIVPPLPGDQSRSCAVTPPPETAMHKKESSIHDAIGKCFSNSRGKANEKVLETVMGGDKDGKFELLDVWKKEAKTYLKGQRSHKGQKSIFRVATKGLKQVNLVGDGTDSQHVDSEESDKKECLVKIHPSTAPRGTWDILSLFLVIYDMGSIPLQFFEPPESVFGKVMEWVTRVFWTIDIALSFMTGFVTMNGFIEMRGRKVFRRYARTWFTLDCAIVGVDWLEVGLKASTGEGGSGYARLGKASRTFRIVRMVRLLRLVRMREVFALITERFNSEKLVIVADITKLIVIILSVAHFIACSWYGIGLKEDADNWVVSHGYTRRELGEKYAMSLHWSLSQFAGGMDEVTPKNTEERTFAIVVFVFAFIMASLFVSSLTSSMTQLNIIGSEQSKKLSVLGKYLHQNGISNKLAMRVKRNAQQALVEQQRLLPENAVSLLGMVSDPLRVEIHLEMYSPHFSIHPFFRTYVEECPMVMRKVCHLAASMLQVSTGDVIFSAGEIPAMPKMYIVCSGILSYHRANGEDFQVREDYWVSEASLWTTWVHRGLLVCSADCRLFELDAKKFQDIASQFEHMYFSPIEYAIEFVNMLNVAEEEPNDLPFGVLSTVDGSHHGTGRSTLKVDQDIQTKRSGRLQRCCTDCVDTVKRKMEVVLYGKNKSSSGPVGSKSCSPQEWLHDMAQVKSEINQSQSR